MIYAFVQDGQSIEILRQQWETLSSYAKSRKLTIDKWLDSTSFDPETFKEKDVLLLEKTFRLAKDVRSIAALLEALLSKGVIICSCEDGVRFGGEGESSAQMAYLFGMVAKIAEELRSQLTKEGLENAQAAGRTLGRPRGRLNKRSKLSDHADEIAELLHQGCSRNKIARTLHVHPNTLKSFILKKYPPPPNTYNLMESTDV